MSLINKTAQVTIQSFSSDYKVKEGSGKMYQNVEVHIPGIGNRTIIRTLTDETGNMKTAVSERHVGKEYTAYLTLDTEKKTIYGEISLRAELSDDAINAFMSL